MDNPNALDLRSAPERGSGWGCFRISAYYVSWRLWTEKGALEAIGRWANLVRTPCRRASSQNYGAHRATPLEWRRSGRPAWRISHSIWRGDRGEEPCDRAVLKCIIFGVPQSARGKSSHAQFVSRSLASAFPPAGGATSSRSEASTGATSTAPVRRPRFQRRAPASLKGAWRFPHFY